VRAGRKADRRCDRQGSEQAHWSPLAGLSLTLQS
jgi:hypothetical protein